MTNQELRPEETATYETNKAILDLISNTEFRRELIQQLLKSDIEDNPSMEIIARLFWENSTSEEDVGNILNNIDNIPGITSKEHKDIVKIAAGAGWGDLIVNYLDRLAGITPKDHMDIAMVIADEYGSNDILEVLNKLTGIPPESYKDIVLNSLTRRDPDNQWSWDERAESTIKSNLNKFPGLSEKDIKKRKEEFIKYQ